MNVKFNLGNKKEKGKVNDIKADELDEEIDEDEVDIEDEVDADEVEEDENSSPSKKANSNEDFKKFIIKLVVIIVGGMLLLFLVLSASTLISGRRVSYEKLEQIMVKAAESYFEDYPESLPKKENQIVEVETPTLTQAGKMKDISEYTKKGISCTGKVSVAKSGDDYVYTPALDCGDSYSTKTLSGVITENNKIVTTGYGLYELNGDLVFRGEKVDNYVSLGDHIWRVVKLDSNKNAYLISEKYIGYTSSWDDRYNSNYGYNTGINNYSSSRIKEYLDTVYNTKDEDERIFTETDKTKLSKYDVCAGKRDKTSKLNDGSIECQTAEKNQAMGLLSISDYINASVDPNCQSTENEACQNYNYLVVNYKWWTATAVSDNTSDAYLILRDGRIKVTRCSEYNYVRPVIKLNGRTMIESGTGTEDDPYIIK